MKNIKKLTLFLLITSALLASNSKSRLIILADMGNEPDEVQQMIHLMMYSNEFHLEGLIAVSGIFLNPEQKRPYRQVLHPELFHEIIQNYSEVLDNLKIHASGWPEVNYLKSIVTTGQKGYGIKATGISKSSPGSRLIVKSLEKEDDRPLYIVVNAGSNTLAQALIDYQSSYSPEEVNKAIKKIRVFENGAQDNAGAWICSKFKDIHWIRSNYQTYCYGGPGYKTVRKLNYEGPALGPHTWKPYEYTYLGQHQWLLEHVIGYHGALGGNFPIRQIRGRLIFLEGGGTIPWLGLIHNGLSDIDNPHWGGWSGRFTEEKRKNIWSRHKKVQIDEESYGDFALFTEVKDTWEDPETRTVYNDIFTPVWRWRRAFFNDFICRMDWCVKNYEDANHNPIASINGDSEEKIHLINCSAGSDVSLDASMSMDPDGDDISYNWWIYKEAGTYKDDVEIEIKGSAATVKIPKNASGKEIHVILELKDNNSIASLYDYRRVVISIY